MTASRFDEDGFVIVPGILTASECAAAADGILIANGAGGTRSLLAQQWCRDLADRVRAHPALASVIGAGMVAVQCTYFEKSAERNWLVPPHQDLSIPVSARVNDPALRGWSEKEGALFVRAPEAVLALMVAVRLHLDNCAAEDGPLRVVPGSHRRGILKDDEALALRAASSEITCTAEPGSALVLRPLLLHASSKGSGTSRRRVLHIVYGPQQLPHGLEWGTSA
jgi:ectoine hydroxylase-related dioxygenase (phytanoyl-CoA dioxygenase family)